MLTAYFKGGFTRILYKFQICDTIMKLQGEVIVRYQRYDIAEEMNKAVFIVLN